MQLVAGGSFERRENFPHFQAATVCLLANTADEAAEEVANRPG